MYYHTGGDVKLSMKGDIDDIINRNVIIDDTRISKLNNDLLWPSDVGDWADAIPAGVEGEGAGWAGLGRCRRPSGRQPSLC